MKNHARLFTLFVISFLLAAAPAFAGGPLAVFEPTGTPIVWDTAGVIPPPFTRPFPIEFNPDLGGLGTLTNPGAVALTEELFKTWEDIPSSSIAYARGASLSVDVATPGIFSLRSPTHSSAPSSSTKTDRYLTPWGFLRVSLALPGLTSFSSRAPTCSFSTAWPP